MHVVLSANGVATAATAVSRRGEGASPCTLHATALPRIRPASRDDSRSLAVRRASSRDVEDQSPSSELFDNGEAPSSQERESVAARLRRRRMQMRAEASGSGVGGVSSGVRRRRRLFEGVPVLDTEYEDEDGNFYDVDAEVVYGGYDDEALVGGRGEEDVGGVASSDTYEDPYLGWGDGPAGNESWSEDRERPVGDENDGGSRGRRGRVRGEVDRGDVPNDSGEGDDAGYDAGYEEDGPASTSSEYQATTNLLEPPDIVILSPQELDRVLPVLPFSEQADFFAGGAAQAVQRWGASLALTVLLSKAALLAATTLTWPLWWPWARAANKNFGVRSKVEYGGIWRTRVLRVETGNRPRPRFGEEEELRTMPRFSAMKTCTIVVGEENGAQTSLVLPFDARYEYLRPGQPAEVLVLSNSTSFSDIKAIKDVYLPDKRLWLAEYPYIDRAEFVEVSLEIAREGATMSSEDDDE